MSHHNWNTRLVMWLAWHLPREMVYWCAVRVGAYASSTTTLANTEMGAITVLDALEVWDWDGPP